MVFAARYGLNLDASVIVWNYRGVGRSTGWPSTGQMLGDDGRAVIQWLIEKHNVKESDILLHGHSMGGGAIAMVHPQYPDCFRKSFAINVELHSLELTVLMPCFFMPSVNHSMLWSGINDRSFRTLGDVVTVVLKVGLGKVMGAILFAYMSSVVAHTTRLTSEDLHTAVEQWNRWLVLVPLGWVFGGTSAMWALGKPFIHYADWEMKSASLWNNQYMVIFHRNDGMMHYDGASLHGQLVSSGVHIAASFELSKPGTPQECHMYPLDSSPDEWNRLVETVRKFWQ